MRTALSLLFIPWITASPALGGLVVTSYRTLAQTNGYAPTSQTQYFTEQRLENVTPADAQVSADWTGPNADGTPDTWHFVGSSHATSTTTITADSYRVEAAASFSYQIDTTAAFTDPASITVFAPGGSANYRGFFEIDAFASYTISAQLNQWGRAQLISSDGTLIFNESNPNPAPRFLNMTGTIAPGRFNILVTATVTVGNLPGGINHLERNGSFEHLIFTARVPEPTLLGFGVATVTRLLLRRQSRS